MELAIVLGIQFIFMYFVALGVIWLCGSFFQLSVPPSIGGLLWRTAALVAAAMLGLVLAAFIPFPFSGIIFPAVLATVILVWLFDMSLSEEFPMILGFLVTYAIAQALVALLLVAIFNNG